METLKLSHTNNCRDLGGTITTDGRVLKKGMLIRGKVLNKVSEKDIKRLENDYKIKTIIDLRCSKEINEKPSHKFQNIDYLNIPVSNAEKMGISHEKKIHSFESLYKMPHMEYLYEEIVQDDCKTNALKVISTILNLPEDKYGVFFHCSAGKDRTGIITAILLSFLGVDRKTIEKDYLLTNKVCIFKSTSAFIGLFLLKWDYPFANKIRRCLLAKKEFLDHGLGKLEEQYGSVANFVIKELKLSESDVITLKNKFLE